MLAQAVTGTPGHVNSMAESVDHFLRHLPVGTMHEGDIYITNDPWMGTGPLNDFVLTTPYFHRGRLVGLFSCTSHLTDIGGIGFGPDAADVHMKGIYIPMLKLADRGVLNETLMAMVRANTRQPVESEGDVYSLAACNDVGCERQVEMMTEFDRGEYICESSRRAPRGARRDREAAAGRVPQLDADRRLRASPRPRRETRNRRRQHHHRLRRHVAEVEPRGQRADGVHLGLHVLRALVHRLRRRAEQLGIAGTVQGGGARGMRPQRALPRPGVLAPHHRPDAA